MAKTYNIREMADAFYGKNYEAIVDFGARYPLVATALAALFAKAPEEAYNFCMALPDYLTGQKLNTAFKDAFLNGGSEEVDDGGEAEADAVPEADEKPVKVEKKAKAEKVEDEASDYASMSGKELYNLIKEKGLRQDYIQKMNDKKFAKPNMLTYIEKYGLEGASVEADEKPVKTEKPAKAKATKKEETTEDHEEADDLENKTPLQLYDICQKRGIKAKTRQPKSYYIGLLKEAEEAEGGPEDWDDSEDVEALEEASKAKAKSTKKAAPKAKQEAEEAEDDEWDI